MTYTFVVTFDAQGNLGHDKLVRLSGSRLMLTMLKKINCVNCVPIDQFTRI
jgi:hypothetical protein